MKKRINRSLYLLFLISSYITYGQLSEYTYKRVLEGITTSWHSIPLPNTIFKNISSDFSDLRIYGITQDQDTIEAPYLLHIANEKQTKTIVEGKRINQSYNQNGYYYTFEVSEEKAINQMALEFKLKNFDWKVTIEGSHDQNEWFTLTENYRILSLANSESQYAFTKVNFPQATYRYFRVHIPSTTKPELIRAVIAFNEVVPGTYNTYTSTLQSQKEDKHNKETVIDLDVETTVPIGELTIKIKDTVKYYRPIRIYYSKDSIATEKGWKHEYKLLTQGALSSLEPSTLKFESTLAKKIRIKISNHDNAPLQIGGVELRGYLHTLVARFTTPATYYLTYGNPKATTPNYDIRAFESKIPKTTPTLTVGTQEIIEKKAEETVAPLFENKAWLWGIMILILIVLAIFSFKMLKKQP